MLLALPIGTGTNPITRVRCQGAVVRVLTPETPDLLPRMAAAVNAYVVAAG